MRMNVKAVKTHVSSFKHSSNSILLQTASDIHAWNFTIKTKQTTSSKDLRGVKTHSVHRK